MGELIGRKTIRKLSNFLLAVDVSMIGLIKDAGGLTPSRFARAVYARHKTTIPIMNFVLVGWSRPTAAVNLPGATHVWGAY